MTRRADDRSAAEALDRWWDELGVSTRPPAPLPERSVEHDIIRLTALDRGLTSDGIFLDRLEGRLFGNSDAMGGQPFRGADVANRITGPATSPRPFAQSRIASGVGRFATVCLVVAAFGGVGLIAWASSTGDGEGDRPDLPAIAAASPDGDAAVGLDDCVVEPPTRDSIGSIRASPAAAPAVPSPQMGQYGPVEVSLPTGPDADTETIAGIEETLRLLTACRYHDREPFILGWISGEPAGRYFGLFTPEYFRLGQPGGFLDVSFAGRDGRFWRPQDALPPTVAAAVVLPDGRVAVIVEDDGGPGTFAVEMVMVLREVDGAWRVDGILDRTLPQAPLPGTPSDRPIAILEFRMEGVSLELVQYSLYAEQVNVFILVNAGDVTRRFTVPDLGIDVTVPPMGQVAVEIVAPVGDHLVVTYSGDEPDPPLMVPCNGVTVNGATLRVFPVDSVAVNLCARQG